MELRHLQYFLTIANEGSFLAASKTLHITQPTLSRQIKEMEDEIGKPLFIRGSRHVTLTEEGIFLKVRATEILSLFNKTTQELTSQDYELSGEIYIGAGETPGFSIIAKAIYAMQQDYPNIKVNIYSADYDDLIHYLEEGLIDFGLVISDDFKGNYQHIRLPYQDRAGILVRKDDPLAKKTSITKSEIKDLPLYLSRQNTSVQMLKNWAENEVDTLNVQGTYNLLYNASILVKEKVGYSFSLEHLINTDEFSDLAFIPFEPELLADLILIWKEQVPFSKISQTFLGYLKKQIALESSK